MTTIKFLLVAWLKRSSKATKTGGFTLIELLIAIVMAVLIITPLMGVAISILDTNRKEQAQVTSEQEVQAGLDYIARDLQQAIYIYDADGVAAIRDQIPTDDDQEPVLVFWKRKVVPDSLPYGRDANECCNDAYVYSLVVYYLIKDNNQTWSNTARIARFEVSDGVIDPFSDPDDPEYLDDYPKDEGFASFNLNEFGDIALNMNNWQNGGNFENPTMVLIDYVDDTTIAQNSDVPQEACPANDPNDENDGNWQQVPDYDAAEVENKFKTYSFYSCISSSRNIAKVFIRGNALARIQQNNYDFQANRTSSYPKARVEVRGTGKLRGQ
ncbi:hormogonium polysaccharide secretion pseudopilin HpsC [Oscillatoria salina]|uniref:hormogonium polysaccharide secretion pseudopilin HpsC n=1 Tax=Oscillatoria salina TaxID=331517 RepID=UPI0013BD23AC|nr:hormogonium polysaccharide secretion pseudopilin HpsC [Oscillatoria salina]MBZ8182213.1 prepilin-type cleavage/methylation domain-containing protein [Oscillatoria salina IIICB1]NET89077.1 prepilin-type cleavage/methylation domain-containing protein [Kamptonema sp. SIO1D9]